ncbi:MAG: glycosyltransferase family 39 protein [Butyrivibrio sp.]|nr:glycosyltransferase family 39 protein [Butyrivibrio sp.]
MRIIDYYNYFAAAIYFFVCAAALFLDLSGKGKIEEKKSFVGNRANWIIFSIILVISAFLRLYKLGEVPLGFQQDEASIGYDAYTLANYGIDRNGYAWPVYPITWGCGGGSPLLIYLNVISIKLFGTGIVKLRLIPALLGILTVLIFYFSLRIIFEKKSYINEASLLGMAFLAVCPWHIILSRWSLDSNIMPFNLMLSIYLFLLGAKKKSTVLFCFSAASFSVCMYSYGAATIVVPVFLLLICAYCLWKKILTVKQLVLSMIAFMVIFTPLLWFYAVNYLGVPEFISPYFCVNKMTAARTGEAFISFNSSFFRVAAGNIFLMIKAVTVGDDSFTLVHYYPGYASLYAFTFPVTFCGVVISLKELLKKNSDEEKIYVLGNAIFVLLTVACMVLSVVIIPDISRLVMVFIPFIYFFIKGQIFVLKQSYKLILILIALILLAAFSFNRDYFSDYNSYANSIFMPGYGDAISRAYEIAGDDKIIYSTYDGLSSPFMLALYYNEYDPNKFFTTVIYKDDKAEFRVAKSFGNFVFELPKDLNSEEYANSVFVLSSGDLSNLLHAEQYTVEGFGAYWVVYK